MIFRTEILLLNTKMGSTLGMLYFREEFKQRINRLACKPIENLQNLHCIW